MAVTYLGISISSDGSVSGNLSMPPPPLIRLITATIGVAALSPRPASHREKCSAEIAGR